MISGLSDGFSEPPSPLYSGTRTCLLDWMGRLRGLFVKLQRLRGSHILSKGHQLVPEVCARSHTVWPPS